MKEEEFFDAVASVDVEAASKLCQLFYKAKYNPNYAHKVRFVDSLEDAVSPQDVLDRMFTWHATPEGGSYWANISTNLPKGEKQMTEDKFFNKVFAVNPTACRKLCKLYYKAKYNPGYANEIHFIDSIKHADTPWIAIERMFLWNKTPEGVDYWGSLCDDLERKGEENEKRRPL